MLQVPDFASTYEARILLMLLCLVGVLLLCFVGAWGSRRERRQLQQWAAKKGRIVIDRFSERHGWQISLEPAKSHVRRVDLRYLRLIEVREFWLFQIRVHLPGDTGLHFVAAAWDSPRAHILAKEEEHLIGIDSIDQRFRVDTSNLKETIAVLGDPTVGEILTKNTALRELEVAGDRIDLLYNSDDVSLIPLVIDRLYELALALAEQVSEFFPGKSAERLEPI